MEIMPNIIIRVRYRVLLNNESNIPKTRPFIFFFINNDIVIMPILKPSKKTLKKLKNGLIYIKVKIIVTIIKKRR